jgi:flagellar hook assembly protein FlgD
LPCWSERSARPTARGYPGLRVVLRKLLIVALAALAVAAVASAATGSHRRARQESVSTSVLMPGVAYSREVDFTSRGPIVLDVVTAPRPVGPVYSLAPALSNDALRGTEKLTLLESRVAAGATTVAIDGDYFDRHTGVPSGALVQNGVLESAPAAGRSSLGIGADGTLTAARVSFAGTWQGSGQRRPLFVNAPKGKFTLFTPAYGTATPSESGAAEAVIASLPSARPGVALDGTVTAVASGGPTRIPRGGAVLVARGSQSTAQLRAEAPVGQLVDARLSLSTGWDGFTSVIGGGPLLVSNGKPVFHAKEAFDPRPLNRREPRAAIGQLADGRIVLVSVEGTDPAYSIGMSSYELAVELSRLGATTAFGLGSGPAAGIAFDGRLLTRPSTGHEAKVSDALVLSYSGAYAAPPSTPVLSPNGDGVGESETLSYRVARPSNVVATLAGPGGTRLMLADGAQPVGVHTIEWNGTDGGVLAPEGAWTFSVTATDDRGVTTSAERTFSLDDTLLSLSVRSGSGGLPTATFQLTRPATVSIRIERPNGVRVATVRSGSVPAGLERVTWRGRLGRRQAPHGRYQFDVQAKSSVGMSSLTALFSLRSHTRH